MKPGRELDVLIAEKIMGDVRGVEDYREYERLSGLVKPGVLCENSLKATVLSVKYAGPYGYGVGNFFPRYSTDIAAAWEVVEKFKNCGTRITLYISNTDSYEAEIDCSGVSSAFGESIPHAICLVALMKKSLE